jgi:hypothetical protein
MKQYALRFLKAKQEKVESKIQFVVPLNILHSLSCHDLKTAVSLNTPASCIFGYL